MKRTPQIDPEWYRKFSKNRSGGRFLNTSGSAEQAKTKRNVAIEIAMDLCIAEQHEMQVGARLSEDAEGSPRACFNVLCIFVARLRLACLA